MKLLTDQNQISRAGGISRAGEVELSELPFARAYRALVFLGQRRKDG